MSLLHRTIRLVTNQDVAFEKPLVPAIAEAKLPYAIIYDKRIFLLLERPTATYLETIPLIINEVH